jgi:prevent-host-death family protein
VPNRPKSKSTKRPTSRNRATGSIATWDLRRAKAQLSEVIRRADTDGPQHITVHGHERAVVLSAQEYQAIAGSRTGAALTAALQACPYPDFELPTSERSPVKAPELLS